MEQLPTICIRGTEFVVDVLKAELQERGNRENTISFFRMLDSPKGYRFWYHPYFRNLSGPGKLYLDDFIQVEIPEMSVLHPEGMALRCGLSPEQIKGKTDFELLVDQDAYRKRLDGLLPFVFIGGDILQVDIERARMHVMGKEFAGGVGFAELKRYHAPEISAYIFPYNTRSHSFQEILPDADTLPAGTVIACIPTEDTLDPVGYNRKCGFADTFRLKEKNVHIQFHAKVMGREAFHFSRILDRNRNSFRRRAGFVPRFLDRLRFRE